MNQYVVEVRKLIPTSICQRIIRVFDNNYFDAQVSNANKSSTNKSIRNCQTTHLHGRKHTFGELILYNYLNRKLFEVIEAYNRKHEDFHVSKLSQLDLLKYEANEHPAGYKWHTDFGTSSTQRALSISIALNNEYEGGEFNIKLNGSENNLFEQNVGDALVFPSSFMFPHQVNKVTKGTRYALIAWVY
jgi:PKHD-type hydroxylase